MAKAPSLRKDWTRGSRRTRKAVHGECSVEPTKREGTLRVTLGDEIEGAEPYEVKACAVSRTDGIATRGGRSSGLMTPRRTTDLDPKGRGDKSMLIKRETAEDVYAVVLQRLSDRAKTALFESQSPGVEPHTRR